MIKRKKWHPTRQELLDIFAYEDGELYWKNAPQPNTKRLQGLSAGTTHPSGYRVVQVMGHLFKVHRIIWFIEKRCWPRGVIDHLNGNVLDNRISNLRDCTHTENTRNTYRHRAGKLLGTGWHKKNKKWRAFMRVDGKQIHLGFFPTELLAHQAYLEAMNART